MSAFPELELPIDDAPYGAPVWAYFPDTDQWILAVRHGLPVGSDLWASDFGVVLTPHGPSKFRVVSAPSRWLI